MPSLEVLEEIFSDPLVTDVLFDGANSALVERDGKLSEIGKPFPTEKEIETWIRELLKQHGSRLDLARPISQASIATSVGLIRVHAVLGGECSERTQVSIRRHSVKSLNLENLVQAGSITSSQLETIRGIIRNSENFVIIGGTGSGKTTLLKAILNEVSHERVITIEDSPELCLSGRSLSLVTRFNNHEGVGEISLANLLRESLRMRPDRLVIGEARGEELLLLLQAMNTGHSGAGFTLHANSIDAAVPRMLAILAVAGLSAELAKTIIASSINWAIEVQRNGSKRVVTSIARLNV